MLCEESTAGSEDRERPPFRAQAADWLKDLLYHARDIVGRVVGAVADWLAEERRNRIMSLVVALVTLVCAVVIGLIQIAITSPAGSGQGTGSIPLPSSSRASDEGPLGARSSTGAPLIVEAISGPDSEIVDGTLLFETKLNLSRRALDDYKKSVFSSSERYREWAADQHAMLPSRVYIVVTLRASGSESVRVADIRVKKVCRVPANGTYLGGYSAGAGDEHETYRVGFDLDSPDPVALEMAWSRSRGLFADGNHFFPTNGSIEIPPDHAVDIAMTVSTEVHACDFTFEFGVATSLGTVMQNIGDEAKPFRISAMPKPLDSSHPLSGFSLAYVARETSNGSRWQKVNPLTYTGRNA